MDSHFFVRKAKDGIELTFRTGNNRQLLKWMHFPDMEAVRAFVKMLKRMVDPKHFIVFAYRGRFYFALVKNFQACYCWSHHYTGKQKAEQGLMALISGIPGAEIKGYVVY